MRKQIKQLELDSKKTELDYSLKCEEVVRLQRSQTEVDSLRDKYMTSQQELDLQIKINKSIQEKLFQLQCELATKLPGLSPSGEASYESIIENLKFIIHEQLQYRTNQAELDELKHKVRF